ncbi:MAG: SpoIIE family protein phosphatase [bacterium]|nr:SpoIIE family protein phosphatase [bacterium]
MIRQPLELAIVPGHHQPIYRQIAGQIARAIATRALSPGDRLMPYRELAELLVVSPLAVRKAYDDLVVEGLCDDGGGELQVASPSPEHERERARRELFATLLEQGLSLQELQLAREVQCRLLPPELVVGDGFEVAARNYPAGFVAGDFYDVIRHVDGSVGVVVADVAGKGFGPSLIMATVKAVMPFLATGRSVEETLCELNRRLHVDLDRREFVALAYARLDPASGRVRIADAGLPAPVLLRSGQDPAELAVPGPRLPLGLRPAIRYQATEITLEPGDRLLFHTDGIPEAATGDDELLGYEELARLVCELHRDRGRLSAERWLDALLERVREATGKVKADDGSDLASVPCLLEDDWTALVIERT